MGIKTYKLSSSVIQKDGSLLPGELNITQDPMLGLVVHIKDQDDHATCAVDFEDLFETLKKIKNI